MNKPTFPANTATELRELRAQLRQQFQQACQQADIDATSDHANPGWPAAIKALHEELKVVEQQTQDAFRRQDQRQLSAFMKQLHSTDGPSPEAMQWWHNRY